MLGANNPNLITNALNGGVGAMMGVGVGLTQQNIADIAAYIGSPTVTQSFTLTVSKTGTGSGTITSAPAGISCGSTCNFDFSSGTIVSLTASAAAGSVFAGWNSPPICSNTGSCNVGINANVTLTPIFTALSTQAIVFGAAPSLVIGGNATVSATGGGSGNPVIFTSLTGTICTVSGTTVHGVAAGTCTIAANQSGNSTFSAAPQTTQSFTVFASLSSQSITFANPGDRVLNQGSLTLSATASSGLAVSFTSTTGGICAATGNVVAFFNPGTCTISASQPGGGSFAAATAVPQSFAVTLPPLAALSMRGGIDIDGLGKSAIPMRATGSSMMVGRLVNNTQIQFTPFVGLGPNFRLVGAVDFNGNGKSDLAYQDFVSDPQGIFGEVRAWTDFNSAADRLLRNVKLAWAVEAFGDLDGDGFGDLVFRFRGDDGVPNDTGVSYIWFTDLNGVNQVRKRGGAPLGWTLLGAADLNYDGAADMIYISPDNLIKALMATPLRTCANLNAGTVPAGYTALKLSDFTGNRRGDILIRNATTGDTQLLSLNASGLTLPPFTGAADDPNIACTPGGNLNVTNTAIGLPLPPAGSQFFAAGDFNGDGITDIVWVQPGTGQLTLWLMNGGSTAPTIIANAGTVPPGGFTVFQP